MCERYCCYPPSPFKKCTFHSKPHCFSSSPVPKPNLKFTALRSQQSHITVEDLSHFLSSLSYFLSLILNESLKTIRYTLTGTQKGISRCLSTNTSREESETPVHMDKSNHPSSELQMKVTLDLQ